ncbi:MAG: CDP-glucose 4,6-dehydratase [Acidimicrobiia bacterium]
MTTTAGFWNGQSVLVTGHTGFKGTWLTHWLRRLGADVAGCSLGPTSEPNLWTLLGRPVSGPSIDVRDATAIRAACAECRPSVVFHLAAQAFVLESYRHPTETIETNVMGTVAVLAAALAEDSVRCVVVVTSDKVYRPGNHAHRESDPLGGDDPYSASKAMAELATHAYRGLIPPARTLALVSGRAGNVIGGGDWGIDRVLPDVVRSLVESREPILRNPTAIRPWQHVLDPLHGYLLLAQAAFERPETLRDSYNFGPERECSVSDLVDRFLACWPEASPWRRGHATRRENPDLRLDATRAGIDLGWRPRLDLDSGIRWTAEWYRRWHEGDDVVALCDEQLDRYEERTS